MRHKFCSRSNSYTQKYGTNFTKNSQKVPLFIAIYLERSPESLEKGRNKYSILLQNIQYLQKSKCKLWLDLCADKITYTQKKGHSVPINQEPRN